MSSGNVIRGARVGAGPTRWPERGDRVSTQVVTYWCGRGHETVRSFARNIAAPEEWECPRCGCPAGRDQANPPSRRSKEPFKTHLGYVKERRTEAEGEAILSEALERLRRRRGEAG